MRRLTEARRVRGAVKEGVVAWLSRCDDASAFKKLPLISYLVTDITRALLRARRPEEPN
jgi:hypothetical protein